MREHLTGTIICQQNLRNSTEHLMSSLECYDERHGWDLQQSLQLLEPYLERIVEKLDLCGPLELVPAVGGDDELDPVAVLQREVADLVFLAEGNFNFGPRILIKLLHNTSNDLRQSYL